MRHSSHPSNCYCHECDPYSYDRVHERPCKICDDYTDYDRELYAERLIYYKNQIAKEKKTVKDEPKWENIPKEDNTPKEGDLRIYIDKSKRWGWWWFLAQYSVSVNWKPKYWDEHGDYKDSPRTLKWYPVKTLKWYPVKSEHRTWVYALNTDLPSHWTFTKAGAQRAGQRMVTCHNQRIAKFDAQVKDRADRETYRKSLATSIPINPTDLR